MKRVFTDKEGTNPDYESSRPEWNDGFRAPAYMTVPNLDFSPDEPVSDTNQPTLQQKVTYDEARTHVDMPDDTDVTKLIIEGGIARTMTHEELLSVAQAEAVAEFKTARPAVIQAIKVNVDGMLFDGDETSQSRMAKKIVATEDGDLIKWVLADNTEVTVTRAQLKAALKLADEVQSEAWTLPL